jgi:hypothetical protein
LSDKSETAPLDLAALRRLCEEATPGPWEAQPVTGKVAKRHGWLEVWSTATRLPIVHTGYVEVHTEDGESYAKTGVRISPADAAFIAAARTALPALLDRVERAARSARIWFGPNGPEGLDPEEVMRRLLRSRFAALSACVERAERERDEAWAWRASALKYEDKMTAEVERLKKALAAEKGDGK